MASVAKVEAQQCEEEAQALLIYFVCGVYDFVLRVQDVSLVFSSSDHHSNVTHKK